MDLERKTQQWIEQQRAILLVRLEESRKRREEAEKGKFIRKNDDGTSAVNTNGVVKNVKITGDTYLAAGESVMVDSLRTGESKRKRRLTVDDLQRKRVRSKKVSAKRKEIAEPIQEAPAGIFFGYVSYVNRKEDLENHILDLDDFQSSFKNIGTFSYWDIHSQIGLQDYLQDIGIVVGDQTITHDGSLFDGGSYNSVSKLYTAQFNISDYSVTDLFASYNSLLGRDPASIWTSMREKLIALQERASSIVTEEDPIPFDEFILSIEKIEHFPTSINLQTGRIDASGVYDSERDMFLGSGTNDPINSGSNIIVATALDWLYDVQDWPHSPDYFPLYEEFLISYTCGVESDRQVVYQKLSQGSDEAFPDSYNTQSLGYIYDYEIFCRDDFSVVAGCDPSNSDTFPCGPCNCGTGFLGCDYYTFYYIGCDGEIQCEPKELCGIRSGGADTVITGKNDVRFVEPIQFGPLSDNSLYPRPSFSYRDVEKSIEESPAIDNCEYTSKTIFTMRDSLINTFRRAISEGYLILLDIDQWYYVSYSSVNTERRKKLLPLLVDYTGGVAIDQTVMSFLRALSLEGFVYKGDRDEEVESLLSGTIDPDYRDAVLQESDYLDASYDLMFEKIYDRYGPVLLEGVDGALNPLMDTAKVFNCFVSAGSDLQTRDIYSPSITTYTLSGNRSGGNPPLEQFLANTNRKTLKDAVKTYAKEAQDWFFNPETPDGVIGKPETRNDKYNYCLFVMVCGLFGSEGFLFKDLDSQILSFQ